MEFTPGWERAFRVFRNPYPTRHTLVDDQYVGPSLEVLAPAHTRDGTEWVAHINPSDDVTFEYAVKFDRSTFVWSDGKLPGLGGKADPVPTSAACSNTGGRRWAGTRLLTNRGDCLTLTDAWSGRQLFRRDLGLSCYLYLPDPKRLGRDLGREHPSVIGTTQYRLWGWTFRYKTDPGDPLSPNLKFTDGWNVVRLRYRMNVVGRADGIFQGWINGRLGIDLHDVIYRLRPDVHASTLLGHWYYGGPDSDFPATSSRIRFADYQIT